MTIVYEDDWAKNFDGQITLAIDDNEKVLAVAVEEFKSRVENRTPIGNPNLWHPPYWPHGYTPGHLKGNWKIDKYSKTNYVVYNNAPYALAVETGWSTQAPHGMMRVTAYEWNNIVDSAAQKNKL